MKNSNKSFLAKRIFFYIFGIYFSAFAIAITKLTPLGVPPNSSLPNQISIILDMDLGLVTAVVFTVFVIIQWILIGKDFKKINFFQVLLAVLFGYFVSINLKIAKVIFPSCENSYALQLLYMVLGSYMLGSSINIYMKAKWMPIPTEGLARAVSERFNISFPMAKNICDIIIVVFTVILSLSYYKCLYGIREGTIISAVLVGRFVKLSDMLYGKHIEKFIWLNTDK